MDATEDLELEVLRWRDRWSMEADLTLLRSRDELLGQVAASMAKVSLIGLMFRPRRTMREAIGTSVNSWAGKHAVNVIVRAAGDLATIAPALPQVGSDAFRQSAVPTGSASLSRVDAITVVGPLVGAAGARIALHAWGTTTLTTGIWFFTSAETVAAGWVLPLTVLMWLLSIGSLVGVITLPRRVRRRAQAHAVEAAREVALGRAPTSIRSQVLRAIEEMSIDAIQPKEAPNADIVRHPEQVGVTG